MSYRGDIKAGRTLRFTFTTRRFSTGAPYQLAGSPALAVYKDASTTQSTSGITLTVDFDSVTGLNHVAIDLSSDGTFYAAGSDFSIVLTAGTVDSVSVAGETIGSFSIENRCENWAQVVSPTTTVDLTGTTLSSSQVAASVTGAVGSVTAAVALTSAERNSVADALLDRADAIETGWTLRQTLRVMSAALCGKLSGVLTGAPVFRSITDAKNRVTATTSIDGRTAVTLDGD